MEREEMKREEMKREEMKREEIDSEELKSRQRAEALKRMRMLRLHKNVVAEFIKEEIVNLSEGCGMLWWLDEKQKAQVKDFELKHNSLVYHVVRSLTEFGELLSFLYVSDSEEEWEDDMIDLKNGYTCAYVKNLDAPDCSEFGSIGIKSQFDGIVRTA